MKEVRQADVREVSESGLVGHHGRGGPIPLPVGGLGQVDLLKLQQVPRLRRHNVLFRRAGGVTGWRDTSLHSAYLLHVR